MYNRVFFLTLYKGSWKDFVSIHVIKFSESLEDNVIILYSINVKIAKIGFTRFCQTTVFAVFFFYTGV